LEQLRGGIMGGLLLKVWRKGNGMCRMCLFAAAMLLFLGISLASAANVLFVVGNTKLIPGDQAVKGRLEGLGFDVTVVRDYADAKDQILVVISESTGARKGAKDGAKKYKTMAVPIICLNPLLYGDLGMTGTKKGVSFGSAMTKGTINLVDYFHYIVPEDISLGTFEAFWRASTVAWGAPGDRAILVASLVNSDKKYPLFAYWRGSPMPGVPDGAPDDRVAFFLPRTAAKFLTEDGWRLFDSAVSFSLPHPQAEGGVEKGPVLNKCTTAQMAKYGCSSCMNADQFGCCFHGDTYNGCIAENSWENNCKWTLCEPACTKDACDARNVKPDYSLPTCTGSDGPEGKCGTCLEGQWCCKLNGDCFDPKDWNKFGECGQAGKFIPSNLCAAHPATECPKGKHTLTFVNNSSETVWLGANPGYYQGRTKRWSIPEPGGWELKPGGTPTNITVESCWSGNFFLRTGCTFKDGKGSCKTGDCGGTFKCTVGGEPPATLAEFTFDGGLDTNGKKIPNLVDYYDVSYVDGWTKMITIVPKGTFKANEDRWCTEAGCGAKPICPKELKYKDTNYCWSPCKFVTDKEHSLSYSLEEQAKYCCVCTKKKGYDVPCDVDHPGDLDKSCFADIPDNKHSGYGCSPFSQPGISHPKYQCCPFPENDPSGLGKGCVGNTNDPSRVWLHKWAQDYVKNIKSKCTRAYTWQYDDNHAGFKCQSTNNTSLGYIITITDGGVAEE
jgi:hypothetical protein